MERTLIEIAESFDAVVPQIISIESLDIPQLGKILNFLSDLEPDLKEMQNGNLVDAFDGLRAYIEGIVLEEITDFKPLQDGVRHLKDFLKALAQGQDSESNLSETLHCLKHTPVVECTPDKQQETNDQRSLTAEDREIIHDFIMESRDNLETIETSLMELESSPTDTEIINSIFRPFHTIKGVSGFLNLNNINRLAHSTESLLDLARQGTFVINNEITDIILLAVDTMKHLIAFIENSLENTRYPDDESCDISEVIENLEDIIATVSMESAPQKLGELLVTEGKLGREELQAGLEKQKTEYPERLIGEILVEDQKISPMDLAGALSAQKRIMRIPELQVKVDIRKLDNLIDLAGELVISQSMLKEHANRLVRDQKFHQNFNQLSQIVAGIQRTSMSMRMVPIKNTFQKMIRLVRDLAKSSHKQVSLKMKGEDTEIDRNVVEELYEPMVHMIRNAVDHGIESPEQRKAAGKLAKGTILLTAYHKGGKIIIEIRDDGNGLDKQQLLQKAVSKKLIKPDADLTDEEAFNLIFHPGFSTAEKITDISGRGVGMDVVKNSIEKLRGHLDISSQPGKGTTFIISLPLTLAIIEGMVVRISGECYIVPTMSILEIIKPEPKLFFTVEGKGEVVQIRESLVPIVRLSNLFNCRQNQPDNANDLVVVVENKGQTRGLVVDELLGKDEFVIKSLGQTFQGVRGLAGGTILGNGKVGLILDISGIFDLVQTG